MGEVKRPPRPTPRQTTRDEAPAYGVEHWKASSDYWQAELARQKGLFRRLPVVGGIDMETILSIRRVFLRLFTRRPPVLPRPMPGDTDYSEAGPEMLDALDWYHRAFSLETRAENYGAVNTKFNKLSPLRFLAILWEKTVIRRRVERTRRLTASYDHPRPVSGKKGDDLVSFITPTYNRAYCLGRAINSLLGQTYTNWELIVVDDGSTDGTPELLKDYTDDRIKYHRIPKSGVSRARNEGLDRARGRYVCFLDSDNILSPDFLDKMHAAIATAPPEVGLVYCDFRLYVDELPEDVPQGDVSFAQLFRNPHIDLGTIICQGEVFGGGLRFDESMDKWVDYELMLRIRKDWLFRHLKKQLLYYFRLEDGISLARYTDRDMNKNMAVIKRTRSKILKVGYVLWDYPALSQSFVHSEIKWLIDRGVDVKVYYKTAPDKEAVLDYEVESFKVGGSEDVARLAIEHERHLLHSHFAYPAATLLAWPAAEAARLPFTFMPHAVDIFLYDNIKRNRLAEMSASQLCKAVFAYGPYHRDFFVEQGVPPQKIHLKPNSLPGYLFGGVFSISSRPIRRVVNFGRLVEKKGVTDIIRTAERVQDLDLVFEIYGYGPLEEDITKHAKGVPNVRVVIGGFPHAKCMELLRDSDLLFLPCIRASNGDMDGLPTVLMEAAAMGVPVLTTDLSSIPVLVEDRVTGFACKPGDLDCFVDKLRMLAGKEPRELEPMLRAANDRLYEKFHPDVIHNILLDAWVS